MSNKKTDWKDSTLEKLLNVRVFPMREDQDSYLVVTCNNLHKKKLKDFEIEDLRIMIGQDIGLSYLIPLAIIELEKNIMAEGDCYDGDLLKSVLTSEREYWQGHAETWKTVVDLVEQHQETIQTFEVIKDIRNELLASFKKFKSIR